MFPPHTQSHLLLTPLASYVADGPTRLDDLQRTVALLEEQARLAADREEQLKIQLLQTEDELSRHKQVGKHRDVPRPQDERQLSTVRPGTTVREPQQLSEPVMAHIGQMMLDERGKEQFLGAHTGIYFLSSASRKARESLGDRGFFPDFVFGLFFTAQPYSMFELNSPAWTPAEALAQLRQRHGPKHYQDQISQFGQDWACTYPILDLDRFRREIFNLHGDRERETPLPELEECLVFQLFSVLAINILTHDPRGPDLRVVDSYLASMSPRMCEDGSLDSLRALVLYTIVLQLEGRSQLAAQANGIIVRLAQSLGLHRHSRRFKQQPLEVEQRKRLWWCIFICDTFVSDPLPYATRPSD